MAVKHVKTKTGFEIDVDEDCLDDAEVFDALADMQAGNAIAIPVVIDKICGGAKKALYDHCRLENGRVPLQKVSDEIGEIIEAINGKNS